MPFPGGSSIREALTTPVAEEKEAAVDERRLEALFRLSHTHAPGLAACIYFFVDGQFLTVKSR